MPTPAEFDRPLNREELKEQRRRLSLLSPHHVADEYRRAYETCKMGGDPLPSASAVQGLVDGMEAALVVEETETTREEPS